MLLFRFMSRAEYKKYCAGKKSYQLTDHSDYARSQSQGFCFMDMADVKPQEAFDFLSGIVTREKDTLKLIRCTDVHKWL